VTSRLKS